MHFKILVMFFIIIAVIIPIWRNVAECGVAHFTPRNSNWRRYFAASCNFSCIVFCQFFSQASVLLQRLVIYVKELNGHLLPFPQLLFSRNSSAFVCVSLSYIRRKIGLIESNAKWHYPRKRTCKGVLSVWGPLPSYDPILHTVYGTCILITYSHREWGGGEES
jgi:hypothetical protein